MRNALLFTNDEGFLQSQFFGNFDTQLAIAVAVSVFGVWYEVIIRQANLEFEP